MSDGKIRRSKGAAPYVGHLKDTYYWLYKACKGLGRSDEAKKYLELCYNENDFDESISMLYAEELAEHREYKSAVKVLEKSMSIHGWDEYADELIDDIKEKMK